MEFRNYGRTCAGRIWTAQHINRLTPIVIAPCSLCWVDDPYALVCAYADTSIQRGDSIHVFRYHKWLDKFSTGNATTNPNTYLAERAILKCRQKPRAGASRTQSSIRRAQDFQCVEMNLMKQAFRHI